MEIFKEIQQRFNLKEESPSFQEPQLRTLNCQVDQYMIKIEEPDSDIFPEKEVSVS